MKAVEGGGEGEDLPPSLSRWNLPRSLATGMSGRWSNFPRSRAENDPGRDYETASSLGRGATVFTALFSFPYTVCNNRAPALSASSVERSHQTRGKLLTELVARNQASNVCVRIYIYINIDRRRRESHVVLHLSIPNPFDPLIQRVDYMHSLVYIYTTFSYIARYKYKFIDISLREGERKRDEYRSTGLIESIRNDINGKRRYKLALVSFRSPLFAIIDSLPLPYYKPVE